MVLLKNKNSPKTGVRGQILDLFETIGKETITSVEKIGKETVLGVTMLPRELVSNAFLGESNKSPDGKEKSWADEWLKDPDKKDKPPIAGKEGEHSKINPAEMSKKSSEAEEEAIKRRLAGMLNSQFSRASATSEYGQQQARDYQEKNMSYFDRQKREEEQRKQQERMQPKQNNLIQAQGKQKVGLGQKRKKKPMATIENKASQGKQ